MVSEFASTNQICANRTWLGNPTDHEFCASFAAFLVKKSFLDQLRADRALQAQRQSSQRIDVILTQLGLISTELLAEALSEFCDTPIINTDDLPAEPVMPDQISENYIKRTKILPIKETADQLVVATADIFARESFEVLSYYIEKPVSVRLAPDRELDLAIDRLYPTAEETADAGSSGYGQDDAPTSDDIERLRDIASEAPIVKLVSRLITAAIEQSASDVHIEPIDGGLRVRFRIDGSLIEMERLSPELATGITSRVKILAKLNIAERRLPQDGRTDFVVNGRRVDLRVSTMPTLYGEGVVIRILDQQSVDLSFDALGFEPTTKRALESLLAQPNGIILVTGPTGSGKTTTLYAALQTLNAVSRKIFTVEDPIEYELAGINQIQIKPAIGLDFLNCLRSILRQDPDVVMVGEMRDVETARAGVQASLTGHLVLSTLHTNDAASSVTRLLDMGVEGYLLASTLSGILAQRLVRRLCGDCCKTVDNEQDAISNLIEGLPARSRPAAADCKFKQPIGCASCRNTGYVGRTSLVEALIIDDRLRSLIAENATDRAIEEAAHANGMETLYQAGLRKALSGETSFEEVLRVTRT